MSRASRGRLLVPGSCNEVKGRELVPLDICELLACCEGCDAVGGLGFAF
jgi:hypothetical protein